MVDLVAPFFTMSVSGPTAGSSLTFLMATAATSPSSVQIPDRLYFRIATCAAGRAESARAAVLGIRILLALAEEVGSNQRLYGARTGVVWNSSACSTTRSSPSRGPRVLQKRSSARARRPRRRALPRPGTAVRPASRVARQCAWCATNCLLLPDFWADPLRAKEPPSVPIRRLRRYDPADRLNHEPFTSTRISSRNGDDSGHGADTRFRCAHRRAGGSGEVIDEVVAFKNGFQSARSAESAHAKQ